MNNCDQILVSIVSIAYNHELFIQRCLDGFVMQKTNFIFEVLIHDDASTDNTANIIREYETNYPDIIKPIFQIENQYSKGVSIGKTYLFPRAKGKYIAFCEGDDYWTDPYKLQKQVDFLEANEDYGLVYTDAAIYIQESNTFNKSFSSFFEEIPSSGNIFHHLLLRNCIQTLTVVTKRTSLMDAIACLGDLSKIFKMGDYPRWLEIARNSKIKYLNDITAVYRKSTNSASCYYDIGKRYDFLQSSFDIQFYFCKKYNLLEVQKKIEIEYNRFLCIKAFDLKEKISNKNILRSFKPTSLRDRLIKISLQSDFMNFFVRILLRIVFHFKALKNKI